MAVQEYALRDCNNQLATVYTNNLLTPSIPAYLNQIVSIAGYPDNCWVVTENTSPGFTVVPVVILNSYLTCADCSNSIPVTPPIFKLKDCTDPLNLIYTTDILTPGIIGYNGGVVFLSEYLDKCWQVSVSLTGSPLAYNVVSFFTKCTNCVAALPPAPIYVYRLINCQDDQELLYSFTQELGDAVGRVVKLAEYLNKCWSVSTVVYDDQNTVSVTILQSSHNIKQIFDDCECCLPSPPLEPVKYTRVIPKPDRKFYQILQSQCDINANIKFADNYYRLFKKLKYGMNSMCDNVDLDKVWIKKQLSDLAVINDPTACVITPAPEPIVCAEPDGNPFIPPVPTTYTFTVGEPGVGTGTFGCTTCLDGTAPQGGILCPVFNMVLDYNILNEVDPEATYAFSNGSGCVITLGSFIQSGSTEGYATYGVGTLTINNVGVSPGDPCASCF